VIGVGDNIDVMTTEVILLLLLASAIVKWFLLWRLGIHLERLQQDIATEQRLLVTWAATWGQPPEEVRKALMAAFQERIPDVDTYRDTGEADGPADPGPDGLGRSQG
jgi:hypothetical protein